MPFPDRHRRISLFAYLCVMAALLLLPAPLERGFPGAEMGLDKVVHAVLFAGLAFLLFENLPTGKGRSAVAAVLIAAAAAGLIEIIQKPLPYRAGELLDFVAGVAGALVGAALAARFRKGPGAERADGTGVC